MVGVSVSLVDGVPKTGTEGRDGEEERYTQPTDEQQGEGDRKTEAGRAHKMEYKVVQVCKHASLHAFVMTLNLRAMIVMGNELQPSGVVNASIHQSILPSTPWGSLAALLGWFVACMRVRHVSVAKHESPLFFSYFCWSLPSFVIIDVLVLHFPQHIDQRKKKGIPGTGEDRPCLQRR